MSRDHVGGADPSPRRLAWWVWPVAALGYLVAASLATWPVVTRFGVAIPGELTDPLEHLWIMRWLRSCLIEGRNPLFCPFIQAPVGVPLGYFPTLHLQTALYLVARLITANDAAIFTTIWFLGFGATGLASFALARWAVPGLGEGVAWVAGLGVMLCGPMLMHAHGHLETMQLGVVPPFLIAWIGWIDRPGWGRLSLAAAAYLLLVAAAPYFAVLAIFPAVWYAAAVVLPGPDRGARARQLAPWLASFACVILPGVAILFGGQIWAAFNGFPMTRSKRLFDLFGAPVWSSFTPSPRHALGATLLPRLFDATGYAARMTECASYLGLIPLGLLGFAAWRRVVFPRRGFWWSVLGLMIVLSWGSRQPVFGVAVPLPAGWIYDLFPPFHLIRVPARFNLFAAAVAVVPAAAGLQDLVHRRRPASRVGLLAVLAGLTLADLATIPFPTAPIPDPPAIYAELQRTQPDAVVLDAPVFDSTQGQTFASLWGYWQQRTGLATSGGYPGLTNTRFDAEVAEPSVFAAARLRPETQPNDFGRDGVQDLRGRAWLELTTHGFDVAIWHHGFADDHDRSGRARALAATLAPSILQTNPEVTVFARSRLAPPDQVTWMTDQGWRLLPTPRGAPDHRSAALPAARIALYQPQAGPLVLRLGAVEAFGPTRTVRVVEGASELARWTVEPGTAVTLDSPPVFLSAGLHLWSLWSDGATRPTRSADRLDDAATPYSFRLSSVRFVPAAVTAPVAAPTP